MKYITIYTIVANTKENYKIIPMKNILMIFTAILTSIGIGYAQTTATDFITDDCNGVTHNLFDSLDNGSVIVIAFVMPCGTDCEEFSLPAYYAVQSFNAIGSSNAGRVHFYLADDYGNGDCTSLNNFSINMPFSSKFDTSDVTMLDYLGSGVGMPKVVVLGGADHTVFYNMNDNKINFLGVEEAINNALNAPLNIEQTVENKFKFLTFPNPVNNTLNVSHSEVNSEIITFSVIDLLGKIVIQENKFTTSIDVSSLKNGNYFLKVSSETSSESIPFVVNH